MRLRYFNQFDAQPLLANVRGQRIKIGSADTNDIILRSPFVDPHAVEVHRFHDRWMIRVIGSNGCEVSKQKFHAGETTDWNPVENFQIFPYVFAAQSSGELLDGGRKQASEKVHQLTRAVHLDLVEHLHMHGWGETTPDTPEKLLLVERSIESSAANHGMTRKDSADVISDLAAGCVRDAILEWILDRQTSEKAASLVDHAYWCEFVTAVPLHEEELNRWKLTLANRLFERQVDHSVSSQVECVEKYFWETWGQVKEKIGRTLCEYLALRQLKKQVKDTLFGFGPLEDLLRLPTITEIMVNASDEIFIEKSGVIQNSGRRFVSDEVTQTVIERIVGRVGRRIDVAQPMVDARLPDGSRVNAVIPPLAVKGPCLTIRKFSRESFTLDRLVEFGSLSRQVQEFLAACVRAKRSVLISGGTGTGKTTLLNCLSQQIPIRERIICIEDTHELQLDHPHVVFTECRDGNSEGKGKIAIRDLLKNALRQRPDRLIVGECRGDEALDMLQAMNTGHDGSMTTIHANTPADALRRLEVLVRESGLPPDAVRQQIVSAIDLVVQLTRCPDGRRIVSAVDEVVAFDAKRETIRLRPIFQLRWDTSLAKEVLGPTGCVPTFAAELVRDKHLELDIFLRGFRSMELSRQETGTYQEAKDGVPCN